LFWGMEGMEFQCSTHFYLLEWCQITFLPHVKISRTGSIPAEPWMGTAYGERKAYGSITKISKPE
jgi:hypothetical protein